MTYLPVATDDATVIVIVEVPAPIIEVGLKKTFTPVGWPDAARLMVPSKPLTAVVVTVKVPEMPCGKDTQEAQPKR